jgi:predicted phage terminase large subunit-like protein
MCSQIFPAWFVGRNPTKEVVLASYAADLAERNSRVAKNLVESECWPFEDVKMAPDSKAVSRWNVTKGGGCRAIGVEGGITGRGADVLCIDDPHATPSESEYERGWDWYQKVVTPRLNGGARVILVSARFGDLDLAGRILESEEADEWTVLRIPAICDSPDDPLGREIGEALWPEHMSVEEIAKRRVAMGPAAWSAQFQQDPIPDGGLTFKSEWFDDNRYERVPVSRTVHAPYTMTTYDATLLGIPLQKERPMYVIQAADSAWKTGVSADRSAIVTLASDMRDIYVTDCWFGRLLYPDLRARVVEEFTRQKQRPSILYVEEASSGFALVEDLKRTTGIPIKGIPPGRESKEARAESVTGLFESGRIKFPRNAPWVAEMISECLRFPNGRHDDMVDALVLGIRQMRDTIDHYHRKQRDQALPYSIHAR